MSDTTAEMLKERGARYGKFEGHALITQLLKQLVRGEWRAVCNTLASPLTPTGNPVRDKWLKLAPDQQEALDMICHKVGRIVNGDPDYIDSWDDIAGYARLVADRLRGEAK